MADAYVAHVAPVTHPSRPVVYCSVDNCGSVGRLYLTEQEAVDYQTAEQRLFTLTQGGCAIKAAGDGLTALPGANLPAGQTGLDEYS